MSFENPAGSTQASTDRYVQSLLELLGQRDPLVTMPELPSAVAKLVTGLDDTQLRRPEKPGKWCVIEVVQHLADTEIVYGYRVRKTLAAPGTTIAGYDQDAWARTLRYGTVDLEIALQQLRALRTANLRLLGSLSPAEWERAGMHSERGLESVRQVSRLVAGHDFVHLNQIARIKTAIGA
jgi:DinB family protein